MTEFITIRQNCSCLLRLFDFIIIIIIIIIIINYILTLDDK